MQHDGDAIGDVLLFMIGEYGIFQRSHGEGECPNHYIYLLWMYKLAEVYEINSKSK